MNPGIDLTTEEDIDRALADAATLPPEILALTAVYHAEFDLLLLKLSNGRRLALPREDLQELEHATPSQLAQIEIFGGDDIAFPLLDVDLYLPYLLEGRFGTEDWMQSLNQHPVTPAFQRPVAA